jgi:hypothetical protein
MNSAEKNSERGDTSWESETPEKRMERLGLTQNDRDSVETTAEKPLTSPPENLFEGIDEEIAEEYEEYEQVTTQEEVFARINRLLESDQLIDESPEKYFDEHELEILIENLSPEAIKIAIAIMEIFPELKDMLVVERPSENIENLESAKKLQEAGLEDWKPTGDYENSWILRRGDKIVMVIGKEDDKSTQEFREIMKESYEMFPPGINRPVPEDKQWVTDFTFFHEMAHVIQLLNGYEDRIRLFEDIDSEKYDEQSYFMRNYDIIAKLGLETAEQAEETSEFLNRFGYGYLLQEHYVEGESIDDFEKRILIELENVHDFEEIKKDIKRFIGIARDTNLSIQELLSQQRSRFSYRMSDGEFEADEFAVRMMSKIKAES